METNLSIILYNKAKIAIECYDNLKIIRPYLIKEEYWRNNLGIIYLSLYRTMSSLISEIFNKTEKENIYILIQNNELYQKQIDKYKELILEYRTFKKCKVLYLNDQKAIKAKIIPDDTIKLLYLVINICKDQDRSIPNLIRRDSSMNILRKWISTEDYLIN